MSMPTLEEERTRRSIALDVGLLKPEHHHEVHDVDLHAEQLARKLHVRPALARAVSTAQSA